MRQHHQRQHHLLHARIAAVTLVAGHLPPICRSSCNARLLLCRNSAQDLLYYTAPRHLHLPLQQVVRTQRVPQRL